MIEIDAVHAVVRRDGRPVDLPPRELALLTALAAGPRACPSYTLVPLLWPRAVPSQSSSLKVYIHRLRRRLGPSLISSTNKGYELNAGVRVDLRDVRALLQKPALTEMQRQTVSRFYFAALSADRTFLSRWDWFAGTEALIAAVVSEAALRLAREAIARNKRDEAHTIVRSAALLNPTEQRFHNWPAAAIS